MLGAKRFYLFFGLLWVGATAPCLADEDWQPGIDLQRAMAEVAKCGLAPRACWDCNPELVLIENTVSCAWNVLTGANRGAASLLHGLMAPVKEVGRRLSLGVRGLYDDSAFGELADVGEKDLRVLKKAGDFATWVAERDVLVIKAAVGNKAAAQSLARLGAEDRRQFYAFKEQASLAVKALMKEYHSKWIHASQAEQTKFLCELVGRLGFEGVALLAGGRTVTSTLKLLGQTEPVFVMTARASVGSQPRRGVREFAELLSDARQLSKTERVSYAQELLGRSELSAEAASAIEQAAQARSTLEKMKILKTGGFSEVERNRLFMSGICRPLETPLRRPQVLTKEMAEEMALHEKFARHVVDGDFKNAGGKIVQIKGGMHTPEAFVQNFIKANEKLGVRFEHKALEPTDKFFKAAIKPGELFTQKLENGVMRLQLPREAWARNNLKATQIFNFEKGRLEYVGVKTLWPDGFDAAQIERATREVIEKGTHLPGHKYYAYALEGEHAFLDVGGVQRKVRVTVNLAWDEKIQNYKIVTSYPSWNQ